MPKIQSHRIIFSGIAFSFLFLFPLLTLAQENDSTRQEIRLDDERREIILRGQFDRSMSGGIMTEMGAYQVPTEKQYYVHPFKGQYYLDLAVEAYRKELENRIGDDWYWQFLKAISPYINNQFQFGFYNMYDIEFVDRDHPLLEPVQ